MNKLEFPNIDGAPAINMLFDAFYMGSQVFDSYTRIPWKTQGF